jgi:hypothetical protein
MNARLLTLALALIACDGGKEETGTDTGDTDTGTDTGVDCEMPFAGSVHIDANQPFDAATVKVAVMEIDTEQLQFELVGAAWQTDVTGLASGGSADFSMCLPATPDAGVLSTSEDMEFILAMVGAYVDSDGSGEPNEGDLYVGATFTYVGWFSGTLTDDFADAGVELGWNSIEVEYNTGAMTATPMPAAGVADHDLPGNLLPVDNGPLLITIVPALDGEVAVGVTSTLPITGDGDPAAPELATLTVDATDAGATATFEDLAVGDDDHFSSKIGTQDALDFELAQYLVVAYTDTNDNDMWDIGVDPTLAATSAAGNESGAAMYARATGFRGAIYLEIFGQMGWSVLPFGTTPVTWETGLKLDNQFGG